MDQNVNYYGIILLLRQLRESGSFSEKGAAEGGGTDRRGQRRGHYDFSLISSSFSSFMTKVVVVFVLQKRR